MGTTSPSDEGGRAQERFQPPANNPPGQGLGGVLRNVARRALDLQVHTVQACLAPWLKSRGGSVLEVGCGMQPYRHLLPAGCRYQGLDWALAAQAFNCEAQDVRLFDGGAFPFPGEAFDSVFHTEVLEHVPDPGLFLGECRRVLKKGGELFFTVPFQARYHYIPYDYWRYTPAGLALLLEKAGFRDMRIAPRGTDVTVAGYKAASVAYRWIREGAAGRACAALTAPVTVAALAAAHLSLLFRLGSTDDCLGFTVTAKAP